MSSKRFFDESKTDPDHPNGKKIRPTPSLSSKIGEVVVGNFLDNFCSVLEPMLRRVFIEDIRLSHPTKVEIVVLDGDFPPKDHNMWTSEEFDKKVKRERTGKRPLLAGDVLVTMRDGVAHVREIEFTDNSSWTRGRKFRLGARVVQRSNQGAVRVREAMTEPFVVKDHRGECKFLLISVW
ncbi:hypothetical protein HYC85_005134 [Camellia sinensis]|uniref:Calmodulin binding protein-like N-terminal domain-containing protein n=1 Tax=Camellia sinensis TaxID=4442 RepID=A0A7J7HZ16_CAMSI|nr:hypothetical protein HYC85_005134 [Camellia sinensis]